MTEISFDDAATQLGINRSFLNKIVKNGKEIPFHKSGRKYVINQADFDHYQVLKETRKVELDKADFLNALKFALEINYHGHTRGDFNKKRQRPFMQAVENWTQGGLAEIALQKFIKKNFNIELQIEFRIFTDAIVGQDITAVKRGHVINPPRKNVSVKSGKENGMVLIVPIREVEANARLSDCYVFVRVVYPVDIFARFYRDLPEFIDIKEQILPFENATAFVVGYCYRHELEKRAVPEADIEEERYVCVAGHLRNKDDDWKTFADSI
jgi:excisionase family DNA binding protein